MSKEMWNDRYSQEEYIYGTEPNDFLKSELPKLKIGKILFPCDGEGRNSVFASTLGWESVAFDQSEFGKIKADKLALIKSTKVDFRVNDIQNFSDSEESYDAIVYIYMHFPSSIRKDFFNKLNKFLKKGGTVILEVFSKKQIENNSGGPKDIDMLYNKEIIEDLFADFEELKITETTANLTEGDYHKGDASIIRLIGKK